MIHFIIKLIEIQQQIRSFITLKITIQFLKKLSQRESKISDLEKKNSDLVWFYNFQLVVSCSSNKFCSCTKKYKFRKLCLALNQKK